MHRRRLRLPLASIYHSEWRHRFSHGLTADQYVGAVPAATATSEPPPAEIGRDAGSTDASTHATTSEVTDSCDTSTSTGQTGGRGVRGLQYPANWCGTCSMSWRRSRGPGCRRAGARPARRGGFRLRRTNHPGTQKIITRRGHFVMPFATPRSKERVLRGVPGIRFHHEGKQMEAHRRTLLHFRGPNHHVSCQSQFVDPQSSPG